MIQNTAESPLKTFGHSNGICAAMLQGPSFNPIPYAEEIGVPEAGFSNSNTPLTYISFMSLSEEQSDKSGEFL